MELHKKGVDWSAAFGQNNQYTIASFTDENKLKTGFLLRGGKITQ